MSSSSIELLTAAIPNGQKVSIYLEELGIPYTATAVDSDKMNKKPPDCLTVNPSGPIPAIIDHSRKVFAVFEFNAIFLYLAEHYDKEYKFTFEHPDEKCEMTQWLFHCTGVSHLQCHATQFFRDALEKIQDGFSRYRNETKRLYSLFEVGLQHRDYLCGRGRGKYSIADICGFTWVRCARLEGIDLDEFPKLKAWMEGIEAREAVRRGLRVPDGEDQIERVEDPFEK
ncbi:glutathione S-transferase [Lentithecium fluviatile CBS 122367]|uniref:Glutathione S-transferase n=1 Tax=Lentithecium fluviatile CBS 122367 TaxID=1168545 RepID=A0A6G1JN88_9PLEO|nr:glutathione S-transferase [Lentithecium fluviatile CBS 122367]